MQLLTGPAGSGKTFTILEALRAALKRRDSAVRLLVPTATMAQHLRNQMAREGLVFSPSVIQTISRFIEPWAADLPQVADSLLPVLVEKSVQRLNLPEFAKVAHLSGFHARLAATIEECSASGCSADSLRRHLPVGGLGRALAEVYAELNRRLEERKIGMRSARLDRAAARIDQEGIGGLTTVWLDGFFSLTDSELAVVGALTKQAEVTVTLPSASVAAAARARLVSMGFREQVLQRERALARRELFWAPGIEREVDEIARRILREASGGRPFHEMGIIVRAPEVYQGLLRATLERFGIPARFYFDSVLMEQPAIRYLAGAVEAMLGGWDHAQTLKMMKLAPGAGISSPMDRFDFEVRKRMPGSGLDPLRQLTAGIPAGDQRLSRLLDRLVELDAWRSLSLKPAEWAERMCSLRALYRPGRPLDGVSHQAALDWRSQARALDALEAAAAEAASTFDAASKVPVNDFWKAMTAVLRLTPLRVADQRRNVVHVLSAHEARQWELPVMFVCGLVEGQFPRYHPPDPFLPEAQRRRLKDSGIRIRTAEDTDREEHFLFDSALSRATASLVLSYPKNDSRGEQNLPSLFLERAEPDAASRPIRLQAVACEPAMVVIRATDLLQVLVEKHAEVRPTALETYLQCPFQFFARHTLKLEGRPQRPEERLEFRGCGTIVHGVVAQWLTTQAAIEEVFERVFHEVAQKEFIPAGYKTELLRSRMLADLRRFAESDTWTAGHQSESEVSCRFELDNGLAVRGRIDRVLKSADGKAFVIDYKYSKKKVSEYTGNENLLQGPLYWLAAERGLGLQPAGMYYCSLRDRVEYGGWGEPLGSMRTGTILPFTREWLTGAMERGVRTAQEIASGRIAPLPSDVSKCRYCDFLDVCRYSAAPASVAEGA
ncbi:MAG: PD-(D/E)XK nuclease family protein [Acidobacteriia bacterium]|nr:PD-(D/E)XK nuclease family protein [Terriglobia bacterium]